MTRTVGYCCGWRSCLMLGVQGVFECLAAEGVAPLARRPAARRALVLSDEGLDPTTAVRDPLPSRVREQVSALRDAVAARYGMEVAGWVMLRWQIERLPIERAIEAELSDPTPDRNDDR